MDELVSDAMNGSNMNRPRRIRFELRAKRSDVVIDSPADRICLISPDFVEQLLSGYDLSGPRHEQSKSREFLPCHSHRLSTTSGDIPAEIHLHIAEFQFVWKVRYRLRSAQQRSHPRHELPQRERFRHVVISAKIQSDHPVGLFASSR